MRQCYCTRSATATAPSWCLPSFLKQQRLAAWNPRPGAANIHPKATTHGCLVTVYHSLQFFLAGLCSPSRHSIRWASSEMAGMWPIFNPNKPLQLHTLQTMGSLLYLLVGCVLESSSNLPKHSWATKQTMMYLRSPRLCLYLLRGDFCDNTSWSWDPNTDISNIYTFETYSLSNTYVYHKQQFHPTSNHMDFHIAFCSRARLLQGSSFKALSRSASQVNSPQEWTAEDFSQPSLLLANAAAKHHHVIPRCMESVSRRWHDTEMCCGGKLMAWALYLEYVYVGIHYPSSCTCPHSQMISGFHCYKSYSLWTFMRCLSRLIEKHETTTACGITGAIAAGFVHLNVRL